MQNFSLMALKTLCREAQYHYFHFKDGETEAQGHPPGEPGIEPRFADSPTSVLVTRPCCLPGRMKCPQKGMPIAFL